MSERSIPPALQQKIARLQQLQQTLNMLLTEKQRIDAELTEISNALRELGKVSEDSAVYRAVGPVLLQADKEALSSELTEKKELDDTRLKILEKQESRTRAQAESLQKEIQKSLSATSSEAE